MFRNFLFAFFLGLVLSADLRAQADSLVQARIMQAISDVRSTYAPDRREKVWMADPRFEASRWIIRGYTTEPAAREALSSALRSGGITFVDSIEPLPSARLGAYRYGLATVSVSNNRYEPRQASEMATQMTMGMPVEILLRQGDYLLVRTPDGYISWTESLMVARMTREQLGGWNKGDRIVYTEAFGQVKTAPRGKALPVSDIVAGGILKQTGSRRGYYAVQLPDGRKGFVRKSATMPWDRWISTRKPEVETVEQQARSMMGHPYLWGGTSVKGVDCSGFVKTAWFLQGMILPRDASQQAGIGETVDIFEADTVSIDKALRNLRRGDLLLFSSLKDGRPTGRITHIAIYLEDGNFIHASGLVRINNMKPGNPALGDWHTRAFVGARRIEGKQGMVAVGTHAWYIE
jgi:hypothetical protein